MKAVMISIQPQWCKLITSGDKTVEVRKTKPKIETPFKCYIYQTKTGKVGTGLFIADREIMGRSVKNGKVIGEFVCDRIRDFKVLADVRIEDYYSADLQYSQLNTSEITEYIGIGRIGYGWHISNLVIYDKPKELSDFRYTEETVWKRVSGKTWIDKSDMDTRVKKPPQSWCYVEDLG